MILSPCDLSDSKWWVLVVQYSLNILDKMVDIHLTRAANKKLSGISHPLCVQMELYFSCLIRKRVLFNEVTAVPSGAQVTDKLYVEFRPVMTRTCSLVSTSGDDDILTDFPIEDIKPFIPKWMKIGYRRGSWQGEFGY